MRCTSNLFLFYHPSQVPVSPFLHHRIWQRFNALPVRRLVGTCGSVTHWCVVRERPNEWAQRSAGARRAVRSKQMNKRVNERSEEQMAKYFARRFDSHSTQNASRGRRICWEVQLAFTQEEASELDLPNSAWASQVLNHGQICDFPWFLSSSASSVEHWAFRSSTRSFIRSIAHLLAPQLMDKNFPSMKWRRRFHIISTHGALPTARRVGRRLILPGIQPFPSSSFRLLLHHCKCTVAACLATKAMSVAACLAT